MKRKIAKSLIATTLLLPTVVSVATNPAEAASATKIDTAVQKAISTSQVLRRACSIEYSGDIKVRPYPEYNAAKAAYAAANNLVKGITSSKKQIYLAKLDEAKTQINRAASFIDAINGGKKIEVKKQYLQEQLKQGVTTEAVKSYHQLSIEINKQKILLDRVYGVTTREAIRAYYKESAEELRDELVLAVTVKMAIDKINTLPAAESAKLLKEAKSVLMFLEVIPQASYQSSLKEEWKAASSKISESIQDEEYRNLVNVNESLAELQTLIKPGISDEKVPVLYQTTYEGIQQIQNALSEQNLTIKLETIMDKLYLSKAEIKELLTKKAIANGIPPEILKAIAMTENAQFEQFTSNGDVFRSTDNGYGILQITPLTGEDTRFDWNSVKYNIHYNIDTGIKILLEKWNYGGSRTPIINDNKKDVLENWYFAIMAYNGLSKRNDPLLFSPTYQDKVYTNLTNFAQVNPEVISKDNVVINYNEATGQMLFDQKKLYKTTITTPSNQSHKVGDVVTIGSDVRFRDQASTSGTTKATLQSGTKMTILEGPIEDRNKDNLFVWYKVKLQTTNEVGYVASVWSK